MSMPLCIKTGNGICSIYFGGQDGEKEQIDPSSRGTARKQITKNLGHGVGIVKEGSET